MTKKILVADDDVHIADLLTQALAEEGYETIKTVQPLRFYDAVREHQPDLILLDLMMPYLEGDDELRLLRMNPETAGIPVIVVTAKADARNDVERYRSMGVVDVVLKPFDLNSLVRLVKRTISNAR